MKKIIALILSCVFVVSMLAACGNSAQTTTAAAPETTAATPETTAAAPETTAAAQTGGSGQKVSLRLGSFPGDTMDFMNSFAEAVKEASNGNIQIEVINFLTMGTPVDAVANTKSGALDMVVMSGNDYVGYPPCSAAITVPLEVKNVEEAFTVEEALYANNFFEDWEGEVLSFMLTDMQYIALADVEIESVDDFKGLIGRCQNNNGIEVLKSLGASVTTIQTSEVYNSLSTGVIDFSVSSPTQMVGNSYGEVCDYILDQPLYCDCNCLIMNNAKYASLDPADQAVLKACGVALTEEYQAWNSKAEREAIETLKGQGVTFIPCPADVLAKIGETAIDVKVSYNADLALTGVDVEKMNKVIDDALGRK